MNRYAKYGLEKSVAATLTGRVFREKEMSSANHASMRPRSLTGAALTGASLLFLAIGGDSMAGMASAPSFADASAATGEQAANQHKATPVKGGSDYRAYLKSRIRLDQSELAIRRVQMEMARARRSLDLIRALHEANVVSKNQVRAAQNNLDDLAVDLEEAKLKREAVRLQILEQASSISVVAAKKTRLPNGKQMAEVTVINDSQDGRIGAIFSHVPQERLASLLRISDIRVSLRDQAIVAEPYQIRINHLDLGDRARVTFELLRDLKAISVEMRFGQRRTKQRVYFREEVVRALPRITPTRTAHECRLGQTVTFDLILEKPGQCRGVHCLSVLNMPAGFLAEFLNPASNRAIKTLEFAAHENRKALALRITVPDALGPDCIDQPVSFDVITATESELPAVEALRRGYPNGNCPKAKIDRLNCTQARLLITPRGMAKLRLVRITESLAARPGEAASIEAVLENTGTANAQQVQMVVCGPEPWCERIESQPIDLLETGETRLVRVNIPLQSETGTATYILNVRAIAECSGEAVACRAANVTMKVLPRNNQVRSALLFGITVLVLAGVLVSLLRIMTNRSRRQRSIHMASVTR